MAFGFPANHTEQFSSPDVKDLRPAVDLTLRTLQWQIREVSESGILASTLVNMMSWGEKVFITMNPDGSITVKSQCSMPTQCFDWGKNRSNVRVFLAQLQRHLEQLPPAVVPPPVL